MTAMPTNNGLLGVIFGPSPGGEGGLLSRLNDPRVAMGLAMMGGQGGFGQRVQAGLGALQGAQQRQMQNQLFNLQMQGLKDKQSEREAERKRREQQTQMLYGGSIPVSGPRAQQAEAATGGAPGPTPTAAGRVNRTEGLLANMGYGPEDIAMFQAMGPDATMKIISERRFPDVPSGYRVGADGQMQIDPGYLAGRTAIAQAGAPRTSVNLPPLEKAYDKSRGQFFADTANQLDQSALTAQSRISQLDRMEAALSNPDVYTGTAGEAVTGLKRTAGALGFNVEGVADAEVAQSIGNQLALGLRNTGQGAGMPGSMSDGDRQFLVNATAGLGKTPAGNALLLDYSRRVARREVEMAQLARDYETRTGRLDAGFYSVAAQYSAQNPLFTDQDRARAAEIEQQIPIRPPTVGTGLDGWSIEEVR